MVQFLSALPVQFLSALDMGMLVFEDEDGLEAFSKWMDNAYPELNHQRMDDNDTKVTES